MSTLESRPASTHEVFNQSVPLEGYNVFSADRPLVEALERANAGWAGELALDTGALAGSARAQRWGVEANANPPVLRTHDRFGHRIDEVEFHPAWHELMREGIARGLHSLPWSDPRPGAHAARAVLFMTLAQVEAGFGCPVSMTYSAVPGAAPPARARRRVGAAPDLADLRPRPAPGRREGGRAVRDGDDREAGRLGRPRQHDERGAAQRRRPRRASTS